MGEKITLSPKDVTKLTGLSLPLVYDLFHRADFPAFRVGRKWVVEYSAFLRWIEKQGGGAAV